MGQATELTQRFSHTVQCQASGMTQGQRGECIGNIVASSQAELTAGQYGFKAVTKHFLALDLTKSEPSQLGLPHPPTDNFHLGRNQWNGERVIAVYHSLVTPTEYSVLGLVIAWHGTVTIKMVRADIQYRRNFQPEITRSLQLKTGKLQHVKCVCRVQQIEGGRTKVATDSNAQLCVLRHLTDKFCHGGFGVGAGNPHYRRRGLPHEEVYIPYDVHAGVPGLLHHSLIQRNPGAHYQLSGAGHQLHRVYPCIYGNVGHLLAKSCKTRRVGPRVDDRKTQTTLVQVARAGQPGNAEADDHPVYAACN